MNRLNLIGLIAILSFVEMLPAAAGNPAHRDATNHHQVQIEKTAPQNYVSLNEDSAYPTARETPISQMLDDNTQAAIYIQECHHGEGGI
ncbi:hypothetical protein [Methylobacterium sp. E-045]|uniref:hypothetical protein n=1 Tax=Methylobacterium sp. E-045 TaxID=2836575 RepID=UPI001FB99D14|nr:hypothetical protein [Methylobacterium sp. E-045]MCJ2129086.1 hypothetical protein [Methylobacterium sp. E-045]